MLLFGRLWSIAALAALTVAAPSRSVPRGMDAFAFCSCHPMIDQLTQAIDVSADVLGQLTLFSQWAAASYCTNNSNSTGDGVSCEQGNCPLVESADTTTLYEFDEYETNFQCHSQVVR